MTDNYMVEIAGLSKSYGKFKALDNIDLNLESGKIYGLLGRNGAGKTTLLNMLSARTFQNSGEVKVFGERVYENIDVLKQVCLVEDKGFHQPITKVKETIRLCRDLYPNWDEEYAQELLKLFELDVNKRYKQLSRGMETSLGLIIGLASRAPLTIFDEPSLGLDPLVRQRFYDTVIEDFSAHPRTIIISTHLIDEISSLFEDIIIMDGGKILMQTNAWELKARAFYLSGKETDVREAAKDSIILDEERFGSNLILSVYSQSSIESNKVEIQPMSLQKLFVKLIDPSIHDTLKESGVIK